MINKIVFKTLRVSSVLLIALMMSAGFVSAVQAQNYGRSFELISELNRVNPEQNFRYEDSKDVLGRKVVDRKKRVIGDVTDVIVDENGSIQQLNVEFNRLRLNTSIFLNYQTMGIQPSSNGYTMSFEADQIEQLYPTLLAETATAAGNDEIFSVRTVLNGMVKNEDGRVIARVDDVLFGGEGGRAEALLVRLSQGTLRGKKVAIPFINTQFEQAGAKKNVVISNDMARAIIDFAKTD